MKAYLNVPSLVYERQTMHFGVNGCQRSLIFRRTLVLGIKESCSAVFSISRQFKVFLGVIGTIIMNNIISLVLAAFCFGCATSYNSDVVSIAWAGKYPDYPFVSDFNVEDFKGKWYTIRATGLKDPGCVYYDLKASEDHQYSAFVYPKNYTMEFVKKSDSFASGFSVEAKFNPFVDSGELKVLMTDYSKFEIYFRDSGDIS